LPPLALPIFTALPYIQPGPEGTLKPGQETVRIVWQTVSQPADFTVEFGLGLTKTRSAAVSRSERVYPAKREIDNRYNYIAACGPLELGTEYRYRVSCNRAVIAEGYFTTRQPAGRPIRFVAFGDNSYGDISDRAIAYQAYCAHPDFIMNTGDNVYDGGLDNEYARYFFPVYNADVAGPRLGAPLLRSVPFYTVLANHDVHGKDPVSGHACANFTTEPDSLAYYTNFHLPLNGPPAPASPTPVAGSSRAIDNFKKCAGDRFPAMGNYSFDWGDAHFLCLDSNVYVDPTDAGLAGWIEADLAATQARWRFAIYHHPAFNIGVEHYQDQQMRALCPLLEKGGVDFVLSGHEHNYQRTMPLRFTPSDLNRAQERFSRPRLVPGEFALDLKFDGETATRPNGIIHLTTGAGGKHLYDTDFTGDPSKWTREEDGHVRYVARMVADRHSLTVFEIEGAELTMRQIDETGQEIDRIRASKS